MFTFPIKAFDRVLHEGLVWKLFKSKILPAVTLRPVKLGDAGISWEPGSVKKLHVFLDTKLNFKMHINGRVNRAFRDLYPMLSHGVP